MSGLHEIVGMIPYVGMEAADPRLDDAFVGRIWALLNPGPINTLLGLGLALGLYPICIHGAIVS